MRHHRGALSGLPVVSLAAGLLLVSSFFTTSRAAADTTTTTTSTTTQTCTDTLTGEGGAAFEPVMDKLLIDDSQDTAPLCPAFTPETMDEAIGDFVGTGASQFANDYVLSERPLTSTEASTAKTNGRSFAYVPFAATPVAIVTLVPTLAYAHLGTNTISSSDFCSGIPLTVTDVGDIFGYDAADPLQNWNDPRITCTSSGGGVDAFSVQLWANNDPTVENEALENLLDSTPATQALFEAAIQSNQHQNANGASTTPSESWPYAPNSVEGGDQALIGKMVAVNTATNAPSDQSNDWQLGAAAPIASDWTGAPLGTAWDLPTAAIQNAQGAFVVPSAAAAAAAEKDSTLAATSDPTTDNLVTFDADASDAAAYNSSLMMEEYLVVPTSGLPADRATKLAQLIRFVLGTTGQKDITSFGAAPATPTMVTAGLKVASEVDAETLSGSTVSTTTTTSASGGTSGNGSPSATDSASTSSDGGSSGTGASGDGGAGTGTLAFTGITPWPLLTIGVLLIVVAEPMRRILRRRRTSS